MPVALVTDGEAGTPKLANPVLVGPIAGAESGCFEPKGLAGICVLIAAGLGLRMLAPLPFGVLCRCSQWQLTSVTSDAAVDGMLSSPLSRASSEASLAEVVFVSTLLVLSKLSVVLVLFNGVFPVRGGDAKLGEASVMLRRKSV